MAERDLEDGLSLGRGVSLIEMEYGFNWCNVRRGFAVARRQMAVRYSIRCSSKIAFRLELSISQMRF